MPLFAPVRRSYTIIVQGTRRSIGRPEGIWIEATKKDVGVANLTKVMALNQACLCKLKDQLVI